MSAAIKQILVLEVPFLYHESDLDIYINRSILSTTFNSYSKVLQFRDIDA